MNLLIKIVLSVLGVFLIVDGYARLPHKGGQPFNPVELKGSAYGAIIGMALQEPIGVIHHGGQSHDHMAGGGRMEGKSFLVRSKIHMLQMENRVRQHNGPYYGGRAVRDYEDQKVRKITELAYEMDPKNYGNFINLSHFYMTSPMIEGDKAQAVYDLAERTISECQKFPNLPEAQLTLAVATELILILRSNGVAHEDYDSLEEYYERYAKAVASYKECMKRVIEDGRIDYIGVNRLEEIKKRETLFDYTLKGYARLISESTAQRRGNEQ
ncbi:hypothetical protein [Rubritalea marina]|uniref:hypothetical protein n=1 Tax=Rubritalea marina TaxID=361055 RepID=UPI0003655B30|nr:hypothetical protein [Rubritalea marina]